MATPGALVRSSPISSKTPSVLLPRAPSSPSTWHGMTRWCALRSTMSAKPSQPTHCRTSSNASIARTRVAPATAEAQASAWQSSKSWWLRTAASLAPRVRATALQCGSSCRSERTNLIGRHRRIPRNRSDPWTLPRAHSGRVPVGRAGGLRLWLALSIGRRRGPDSRASDRGCRDAPPCVPHRGRR